MCKLCTLYGALFNASESDCFPCHKLSPLDFRLVSGSESFQDPLAEAYLRGTINKFQENGISLMSMTVESDGSCLPHAISRGLVGMEMFYDCLRAGLVNELRTHRAWYKDNVPSLSIYDDETFTEEFDKLIKAAMPTRGQYVGREKYLEGVHVLAMANMLMRPIVLLDTQEEMSQITSTNENIDGCGMYLPLRHTREAIVVELGKVASPLIIGWTSAAKGHYVPLLVRDPFAIVERIIDEGKLNEISEQMLRLVAVSVALDQSCDENPFLHFACSRSSNRDGAAKLLIKIITNINEYLQNGKEEKVLRIKESNSLLRFAVFRVPYAVQVLERIGFKAEQTKDAFDLREFVYYAARFDDNPSKVMAAITKNRDYINALSKFVEQGEFHGIDFICTPKDIDEDRSRVLFGSSPLLASCLVRLSGGAEKNLWKIAIERYGESTSRDALGTCWVVSGGCQNNEAFIEMLQRAKLSFKALSIDADWAKAFAEYRARFAPFSSPDVNSNDSASVIAKCPICKQFVRFPDMAKGFGKANNLLALLDAEEFTQNCPGCLHNGRITILSLKNCIYMRMMKWLSDIFSKDEDQALRTIRAMRTKQESSSSSRIGADTDAIAVTVTATSADCGHSHMWVCQQIVDGKLCKVANLHSKITCHRCRKMRTDLSTEELEELIQQQTFEATAALLDNSIYDDGFGKMSNNSSSWIDNLGRSSGSSRGSSDDDAFKDLFRHLFGLSDDLLETSSDGDLANVSSSSRDQLSSNSNSNAIHHSDVAVGDDSSPRKAGWDCMFCTFQNLVNLNVCEQCFNRRGETPSWATAVEAVEPDHVSLPADVEASPTDDTSIVTQVDSNNTNETEQTQWQCNEKTSTEAIAGDDAAMSLGPASIHLPLKRSFSELATSASSPARSREVMVTSPNDLRLYAVVRESFLMQNAAVIDPNSTNLVELVRRARSDADRLDEDDDNTGPQPTSPQRMIRQSSVPVTSREDKLANACISNLTRQERLCWDEVWRACQPSKV